MAIKLAKKRLYNHPFKSLNAPTKKKKKSWPKKKQFPHFWRLKTFKITSFSISISGEISPITNNKNS
jgi:hypothetical protein